MKIKNLFREVKYPIELFDENGNKIYYENSDGNWEKFEYDENGNMIYFERSNGYWSKYKYDENGNQIYEKRENGYWIKRQYDENGNKIYVEDSEDGIILDERPKVEMSIKEIEEKLGIKNFKVVKEK